MKLSGWEAGILSLAALFLAFTAGWFLRGGGLAEPLRVEAGGRPEMAVSLPTPAPEREGKRVNVNTAAAAALRALPGIGEKRAEAIVADREANGPFRFPEDITRVEGIGEDILSRISDYITTEDGP